MSTSREEWINNRAYALWEQTGREHGHDHEHWLQANHEWEELERVALPGHIPGSVSANPGAVAIDASRDEGMTPEELQSDTQEAPSPRVGRAPSAKAQSQTGSVLLGQSEENRKTAKRNGALSSGKDLGAM